MDNAIFTPLVEELRRDIAGAALGDVVQIDSRRFALRFSSPPFPRVLVSLHPDISVLYRIQRVPTPPEPTELAAFLTEKLQGSILRRIGKEPAERSLELEFAASSGESFLLVLELMGKASNLLLLDGERRILRYFRSHGGRFRRPEIGDPYVPPPGREGGSDRFPWGSRLLSREIEHLAEKGRSREEAAGELSLRLREGRWKPCLYTPGPPAGIEEAEDLLGARCFAAPFPMASGEALVRTDCATASEATAAWAELLHRHLLFRDLRNSLLSILRAEMKKTGKLVQALEREQQAAGEAAATRRRGEMLLASLADARKIGKEVELTDHFDPDLPRIRIPIDPRLDLRANAEALFRRARKMERATVVVEERLVKVRSRRDSLRSFLRRIEEAGSRTELEEAEEDLNRTVHLRKVRRPARRDLGKKPEFMRIRRYLTSDGRTVLVGRSSADNDLLTFRIAAPHDFWFHAAGRSGAHVIVRNPDRSRDLPEPARTEAAAIAAWFSKGERAGEVDVHYARRKEVRKGKGMSPGMVMLRSCRTIRVAPSLPRGAREE